MRKFLMLIMPMILAACLAGCSKGSLEKDCELWLDAQRETEAISFTADVTAQYDEGTVSFSLSCAENAEGCTVEVLAPELIKGIKANIRNDGTELRYDSVVLNLGTLDEWGLTPVSAMAEVIKAVRAGMLDSVRSEDDMTAMRLIADDNISVLLYISKDTMTPVLAELYSGNELRISCEISSWS